MKRKIIHLLLSIFLCGIYIENASATQYALLIGVGKYQSDRIPALDGPANDVATMKNILLTRVAGYQESNITTLVNEDATKENIITAIKRLTAIPKKANDSVLIYFSGHGTSAHNKVTQAEFQLPQETGALYPYDFIFAPTPAENRKHLLIGKTDFRPLYAKLQKTCPVLVIYDACFSGNAVRSAGKEIIERKRYMPPPPNSSWDTGVPDSSYPYTNLVYLSSSSDARVSIDISQEEAVGVTADNKAHGAFSEAMFTALRGKGGVGTNGTISPADLKRSTEQWLRDNRRAHIPQLLKPTGSDGSKPFFILKKKADPFLPDYGKTTVTVQLDQSVSSETAARISALKNIRRVQSGGQLHYLLDKGKPALTLAGGRLLAYLDSESQLPKRLQGAIAIVQLGAINKMPQKYPVTLEITGSNEVFFAGNEYGFAMSAAKPSYLLLLNITSDGHCNLLHPYEPSEMEKTSRWNLPGCCEAVTPWGTEAFVGMAFSEKPPFWDKILEMGRNESQKNQLLPLAIEAMNSSAFVGGQVLYGESRPKADLLSQ